MAEGSAGRFSGIAVSMNLFVAAEDTVFVMNRRSSLSYDGADFGKGGCERREGLRLLSPHVSAVPRRGMCFAGGIVAGRSKQDLRTRGSASAAQTTWQNFVLDLFLSTLCTSGCRWQFEKQKLPLPPPSRTDPLYLSTAPPPVRVIGSFEVGAAVKTLTRSPQLLMLNVDGIHCKCCQQC